MNGRGIKEALKKIQAAPGTMSPGQLGLGMAVETEHNKTVLDALKKTKDGKPPAVAEVTKDIAKDHIKENGSYYQEVPGVEEEVLLIPASLKINKLTLKLASVDSASPARAFLLQKIALLRMVWADAAEQWIRQEMSKLQHAINPNVFLDELTVGETREKLQADPNNWKLISDAQIITEPALRFISKYVAAKNALSFFDALVAASGNLTSLSLDPNKIQSKQYKGGV